MSPIWKWIAAIEAVALLLLLWLYLDRSPPPAGPPASVPEPRDEREARPAVPRLDLDPGASQQTRNPSPAANATEDERDTDPVGSILVGMVTDPEGQPLEGVLVQAKAGPSNPARTGRTHADGSFALTGLRAGSWSLSCRMQGYLTHEQGLEWMPGTELQRRDVVLHPAPRLQIRFEDENGDSLPERLRADGLSDLRLVAVATSTPPEGDLPPIHRRDMSFHQAGVYRSSDFAGRAVDGLQAGFHGLLVLKTSLPIHVSAVLRNAVLSTQRVEAGTTEVRFRIALEELKARLGTVRARFVDGETLQPIHPARASLSDSQSSNSGQPLNEEGLVLFEQLKPGYYDLELRAGDYARYKRLVEVGGGQDLDLGTIAVHAAREVRLRVLDSKGIPLPSARVAYSGLEGWSFPMPYDWRSRLTTDENGEFPLEVGRGRYVLEPHVEGYASSSHLLDTRSGVPEEFVIRLQAGVRVVLTTELESPDLRLLLQDSEGTPWIMLTHGLSPRIETELPPGSYSVRLGRADGTTLREWPIEVGDLPIELEIED